MYNLIPHNIFKLDSISRHDLGRNELNKQTFSDVFISFNSSSYQQLAQLHEVEHVALMHLSQLFAQLNGLLPHLRGSVNIFTLFTTQSCWCVCLCVTS